MTNNYILRRLRYTFNFSDSKMIALFGLADFKVTREDISAWLKKDEDPALIRLTDNQFALFLNGFIIDKRGKKDGPAPAAEHQINNNIIFRKLKIALNLIDEDVLNMMKSANFIMGKPELTALFRKPGHRSYRECQDQILRNFLKGMENKYHEGDNKPKEDTTDAPMKVTATPDKTQMAIQREAREKHNKEHGTNSDVVDGLKTQPAGAEPAQQVQAKPAQPEVTQSEPAEEAPATNKKSGFSWQPIKK